MKNNKNNKNIIFESVKKERCINGRTLWLVYETPNERKFSAQYNYNKEQFSNEIDNYFQKNYNITVYDVYNTWEYL